MKQAILWTVMLGAAMPALTDSPASAPAAGGAAGHAPIGVMGDHRHRAGEWMLSYRAMDMEMNGLLDGKDGIAAAAVTGSMMAPGQYMVAPTKMAMEMQMLGVMYAPSDKLTLMVMLPYKRYEMDHLTRMGVAFTTKSSGFGDLKPGGLWKLYSSHGNNHQVHLNASVSLPTGSIDEKDDTPAMADAKLPYSMQLGSGSYDLLPGLTYQGYQGQNNWGAQLSAIIPTGRNDNDYQLGDSYKLTGWISRQLLEPLSVSLRATAEHQDAVEGAGDDLDPGLVTTADSANYGGKRVTLSAGVNGYIRQGALKGHRFALEYNAPVRQEVNGIQLEIKPSLTAGWQLAF